jgi:hypothetical protein
MMLWMAKHRDTMVELGGRLRSHCFDVDKEVSHDRERCGAGGRAIDRGRRVPLMRV